MLKKFTFLCLLFVVVNTLVGQDTIQQKKMQPFDFSTLNEGPFVFIESNKLVEKSIVKGKVISKILPLNARKTSFKPSPSTFKNVKRIAALSDIHGQYDLAVKLLLNNNIIDKNLNWSFGNGHLVIVGDIFDRGDKVHETLLLVYKLEQQAKKVGGRLHFLLGNHEYMVLHGDVRYIHKKYRYTTRLFRMNYNQLYGKNTVLGRWLRSKPTVIKINKDFFVHGGISKEFILQTGFSSKTIDQMNTTMRNSIDRTKEEMKTTDFYKIHYSRNSLIWYRGYFYDNLLNEDIKEILRSLNSKHIVVGHCSNKEVVQLYNHKIYGVDSSIKNGINGELLLINKRKYQRKTLEGKTVKFSKFDLHTN